VSGTKSLAHDSLKGSRDIPSIPSRRRLSFRIPLLPNRRSTPRSPTPMADKEPVAERPEARTAEEEDASAAAVGEEEDTGAHVAPIVRLEEVSVTTGEEDEVVLLDM
jgi:hypothetical protein